MYLYQLAKDFAGPTGTVIASATAGWTTWTLATRQVVIAEQQAQTAKHQAQTAADKLRYNLFERRPELEFVQLTRGDK